MPLNTYFSNYNASGEQQLLENLIIEAIQVYGQDIYYLPRNINNLDQIYAQDDISSFTKAIAIEVYIKSFDKFLGDGEFLGKFGLQTDDQVMFTFVKKRFEDTVQNVVNIPRPREGDLIYFPVHDKIFEIKYVDYKPFFYMLNKLQTYDITCEMFKYSSERFDTGIRNIDKIETNQSANVIVSDFANTDYLTSNTAMINLEEREPMIDNLNLQIESGNNLIDFSEISPLIDRQY